MERRNVYLSLEFSTGKMFEYSKVEKEGFEKYVSAATKTNPSKTSYRKYYDRGIFGTLEGVQLKDSDFGKQIILVLDSADKSQRQFLTFGLFDGKKQVQTYAQSLIAVLPALNVGDYYRVLPYVMENEKNPERKNYGVSVRLARDFDNAVDVNKLPTLTRSYFKDGELVPGDIPATEVTKDKFGDTVYNNDKRDEYLWKVLNENLKGEQGTGGSSGPKFDSAKDGYSRPTASTSDFPEPKNDEPKKAMQPNASFETPKTDVTVAEVTVDEDDEDELPF